MHEIQIKSNRYIRKCFFHVISSSSTTSHSLLLQSIDVHLRYDDNFQSKDEDSNILFCHFSHEIPIASNTTIFTDLINCVSMIHTNNNNNLLPILPARMETKRFKWQD
ncbi:hypothetical protein ACKWTF_005698 [Chironomus riparius]